MNATRIGMLLSTTVALAFLMVPISASADMDAFYYEREDSVITSSVVTGSTSLESAIAEIMQLDEPE